MVLKESEKIELKEIVVDDIKKEIIAFANDGGGKIYIGVADTGEVVGVNDADEVIQQISNMVRDGIKPDITMFIHYDIIQENEKQIVCIDIQRGINRPYYIARKGLRPEGVYVRQGTSTVPATDTAIRHMIKETDGDSFEELRCLEQNLSFDVTKQEFTKRNVDFGREQMRTLKIESIDGIYTNLGFLLSDQCPHSIKVAVFDGVDQSQFQDRQEFTGSLFKQLNEVYTYINMYNRLHASFEGLYRIDTRDYPEVAIREALLNLLVHRDYALGASALISIYSDRIEMVSIGGLLPGVELDDILIGLSVCRNPGLANVFYRLQLIEAYGTGMRKILNAYQDTGKTPSIQLSSHAFKLTLPNINVTVDEQDDIWTLSDSVVDDSIEKVLALAKAKKFVTRLEVERALKISTSTAFRLLKNMEEQKLIVRKGRGKNTQYVMRKNRHLYQGGTL